MKLPPYPNYKPSGVAWLGDIPEHWEVRRLKYTADYWMSNVDKVAVDSEHPVCLCNYTDVYYNEFITSEMDLMLATATSSEIRRFGLNVGDIVITKDSEDWSDIAVPALVTKTSPKLVCGYHLAIIRPNRSILNSRYLLRAFQSHIVNEQFQVAATGITRYGIPKSSIGEAWLCLPSLTEQRAIANYLDCETTKIDALVAKKQTLIERLKEKRTALVSRVVTRGLPPDAATQAGLDPHPKLKSSGVAWLGDVPEHWDVKRLKWSASINDEALAEKTDPAFEMIYVDIGSVDAIRGITAVSNVVFEDAPSRARRIVRDGDTIVSTVRTYLRAITTIHDPSPNTVVSTGFAVIRPRQIFAGFMSYALREKGFVDMIVAHSVGVSYPAVNASEIGALPIPLPPKDEQHTIADYLDCETAKIDMLEAKIEAAIDRLREYRAALITAAVTGKIDVRNGVSSNSFEQVYSIGT